MDGEDSSFAANEKTTPHRKRKRRKWKKSVSCGDGSCYSGGDLEIESSRIGPTWYWSNYNKALQWQNKHAVALWKSYALGLQQENRTLMMELRRQFPGRAFDTPLTMQNLDQSIQNPRGRKRGMKTDADMEDSSSENMGIEFEMSEEMMKFFEQSIKHKLEMKRLKEERDSINIEVNEVQEIHDEREKEMNLLYGDGTPMIIGMETAVQLSFDKYCDLKSPKYWPNIPLKL